MDLDSTQNWTNAQREGTTDSDHLSAIDGLAMLLNRNQSPGAVATIITKAYGSWIEEPRKNSDNDRVHIFWCRMCDAVRTFGSAQDCLIDLLYEMATRPDMKATDGSLAKAPMGTIYWRDLPGLPWALRDEALNYNYPSDHYPDELDEYLSQAPYLLNASRFAAKLFERGFYVPGLKFPAVADVFLEMGIESLYDDKHVVKSQAWKVLLPAATAWLAIAGKTIYKICLDDNKGGPPQNRQRVWNKQKWERWKEQLRIFESRDDFDKQCRGVAAQTREKMVEIEREFQT